MILSRKKIFLDNQKCCRSGVSVDTKPFLWNSNYPEHKYSSGIASAGAPGPASGICSPTSLADPVCSPVTPHQVETRKILSQNVRGNVLV